MRKKIWMFSGQGSQYYQMGMELYRAHPGFKAWMQKCNDHIQDLIGSDLCAEIYRVRENDHLPFSRTLHTHLALLAIQYSLAQTLLDEGMQPDLLLGYSAGEIVARVIAGMLTLEDALLILHQHAKLSEEKTAAGSMVAVLAPVSIFHQNSSFFQNLSVAAINFNGHFVISGGDAELAAAKIGMRSHHIIFQELPISHAFHSPLMDPIAAEMKSFLLPVKSQKPSHPVISCTSVSSNNETVPDLWDVTRQPVLFAETISKIEKDGSFDYIDLGPSGTLATFVKYNLKPPSNSRFHDILNPFGKNLQNLERIRQIHV